MLDQTLQDTFAYQPSLESNATGETCKGPVEIAGSRTFEKVLDIIIRHCGQGEDTSGIIRSLKGDDQTGTRNSRNLQSFLGLSQNPHAVNIAKRLMRGKLTNSLADDETAFANILKSLDEQTVGQLFELGEVNNHASVQPQTFEYMEHKGYCPYARMKDMDGKIYLVLKGSDRKLQSVLPVDGTNILACRDWAGKKAYVDQSGNVIGDWYYGLNSIEKLDDEDERSGRFFIGHDREQSHLVNLQTGEVVLASETIDGICPIMDESGEKRFIVRGARRYGTGKSVFADFETGKELFRTDHDTRYQASEGYWQIKIPFVPFSWRKLTFTFPPAQPEQEPSVVGKMEERVKVK